jgi:hypothetical protein
VLGFVVLAAFIGPSAIGLELVRDGKPVACIIVPSQPLPVESYAAKELQYHIESATGSELPIVSEDPQVPLGVHIFLGHCKATQEARVDPTSLPGNSYILKTIGHDLYLVGNDSRGDPLDADTHEGTLFGVYDILENQMQVRWLWPGKLGEVISPRKDLSIAPADATVIPLLRSVPRFSREVGGQLFRGPRPAFCEMGRGVLRALLWERETGRNVNLRGFVKCLG